MDTEGCNRTKKVRCADRTCGSSDNRKDPDCSWMSYPFLLPLSEYLFATLLPSLVGSSTCCDPAGFQEVGDDIRVKQSEDYFYRHKEKAESGPEEAHVFPVQPPFAEGSDECLPKVLNSNPPPIIKYLALQDLMLLSQYSPSRRQEVFSLSQPGGHPHNWTAISMGCLNLLNSMTQKLVLYQEVAATNGRVSSSYPVEPKKFSSPEETTFQTPTSSQMPRPSVPPLVKTSLFSSKLSTPDVASPPGIPFGSSVMHRMAGIFDVNTCYGSPQSPQLVRRGPRLWTSASDQQMTEFSNPSPSTSISAEGKTVRQPNVIYSWIQNKREQHPEASIQAVFSDAQMHIWALEGLSHLVAASYTEDRFGVVQTTLPAILNTLLTLQEVSNLCIGRGERSSSPPTQCAILINNISHFTESLKTKCEREGELFTLQTIQRARSRVIDMLASSVVLPVIEDNKLKTWGERSIPEMNPWCFVIHAGKTLTDHNTFRNRTREKTTNAKPQFCRHLSVAALGAE
ncbi:Nuclear pore complex subunit [Saguinus oedipus]|uniref:Nucleoporin NDC1 n=1 Tax=Saguinus oedipus TaxID=9490 RepID=A0ABQ9VDC5_SAGOE|nr:Nuclear pore complex subunit [Saguinus oedipus]